MSVHSCGDWLPMAAQVWAKQPMDQLPAVAELCVCAMYGHLFCSSAIHRCGWDQGCTEWVLDELITHWHTHVMSVVQNKQHGLWITWSGQCSIPHNVMQELLLGIAIVGVTIQASQLIGMAHNSNHTTDHNSNHTTDSLVQKCNKAVALASLQYMVYTTFIRPPGRHFPRTSRPWALIQLCCNCLH